MANKAALEALEVLEASLAELAAVIRGTGAAGAGAVVDLLREQADRSLDGLEGVARLEAGTAALKVRLAAEYAEAANSMAGPAVLPYEATAREMSMVAEVAGVLTVSAPAAGALLNQSRVLTTTLPLTLAGLQDGTLSWAHAKAMVEETAALDPAGAAALEGHFLDPDAPNPARGCPAGELVPHRFRHKARTWRERHHPESLEKRHAKAVVDRRVECRPDQDGMAWVNAYLPANTATAIWNRTNATARGLQGPEEARTLTQLRADIFAAALLGNGPSHQSTPGDDDEPFGGSTGPADVPVANAQVLVTVPVFSLLGLTDEPAMLDGHGPIPASMARKLVAHGADSFHRVLVDPRDGAPLEIGRSSYRVTKTIRRWLQMRDAKCPFPGCSNHSLDNEADHLLAWHQGGTTGISNLGQPCPKHHRLKHASGWTPTPATKNEPPGWTSPTGRQYKSEHQDWEPPHWPRGCLPADRSVLEEKIVEYLSS
ncbi:HNH endonuclease signature motif containing protein [Pseudarthrobacter sp. NS4]|uniref:HNH endonuclease signature motif containing protein n=1 Tax=Pseudarthrobacter sp. NS4 TaxID=2973976 RepID=UPI002163DB08|nr:HNH endonuclease signature motif containing protein [Pseudarthrobacter sp. NS4]